MADLNALNPNTHYIYINKKGELDQTKKGFLGELTIFFSAKSAKLSGKDGVADKIFNEVNSIKNRVGIKGLNNLKFTLQRFQTDQKNKHNGKYNKVFSNCINLFKKVQTENQTKPLNKKGSSKNSSRNSRNQATSKPLNKISKTEHNNKIANKSNIVSRRSKLPQRNQNINQKQVNKKKRKPTDAFAKANGPVAKNNNETIKNLMKKYKVNRKLVVKALIQAYKTESGNSNARYKKDSDQKANLWKGLIQGRVLFSTPESSVSPIILQMKMAQSKKQD